MSWWRCEEGYEGERRGRGPIAVAYCVWGVCRGHVGGHISRRGGGGVFKGVGGDRGPKAHLESQDGGACRDLLQGLPLVLGGLLFLRHAARSS